MLGVLLVVERSSRMVSMAVSRAGTGLWLAGGDRPTKARPWRGTRHWIRSLLPVARVRRNRVQDHGRWSARLKRIRSVPPDATNQGGGPPYFGGGLRSPVGVMASPWWRLPSASVLMYGMPNDSRASLPILAMGVICP